MAAGNIPLTGGVWLALSEAFQRKLDEMSSRDFVRRWLRTELFHKRLHYRYLDPNSARHEDDLPDDFWRIAVINFEENFAIRRRQRLVSHTTFQSTWVTGLPPTPTPYREQLIAAVQAYRIEVLWPTNELVAASPRVKTPTSQELIYQEFKRREAAGECCNKVTDEAKYMHNWLKTQKGARVLAWSGLRTRLVDWKLWPPKAKR